eukprot:CAMPEP_0198213694 /NCGR_PEP_ID=MMETSP1445-20131203/30290_1 /TAXON_ID=36898 /ORGANISM="Pyramimonas sp., Strain CCMP2087" /LENGTH=164 /DNA_ID=CAMNT_0043888403 /DNA_START=93 /DNA_END=588 /DNA_ORIENTATION=-
MATVDPAVPTTVNHVEQLEANIVAFIPESIATVPEPNAIVPEPNAIVPEPDAIVTETNLIVTLELPISLEEPTKLCRSEGCAKPAKKQCIIALRTGGDGVSKRTGATSLRLVGPRSVLHMGEGSNAHTKGAPNLHRRARRYASGTGVAGDANMNMNMKRAKSPL